MLRILGFYFLFLMAGCSQHEPTLVKGLQSDEDVAILPQPPSSTELEITAIDIIAKNGNKAEISLSVRNGTSQNFTKLVVMVFPAVENVTIVNNGVDVGAINGLTTSTPQNTFVVSSSDLNLDLDDFYFSFDEQNTVEGIDNNQDGIRDDIEVLIDRNATNSNLRVFLRGFAKEAHQLYSSTNVSQAVPALSRVEDYAACVDYELLKESDDESDLIDYFIFAIANTNERMIARNNALSLINSAIITQTMPLPSEVTEFCTNALNTNQ